MSTVTEATYEIVPARRPALMGFYEGFYVYKNGNILNDVTGKERWFKTRASARKRISREKRGKFHA